MQTTEGLTDGGPGPLPLSQLLKLSVYWLGILAVWGGLYGVVLPVFLERIDPGSVGIMTLGIVVCSVLVGIIVLPVVGRISDYTISRWGKRKPYIIIGTSLDVVVLLGIATAAWFSTGMTLYVSLVALIALLAFTSNFAQGPFQGYVPDLVPARQVALASGLMGLMLIGGRIVGLGIAAAGVGLAAWMEASGDSGLEAAAGLPFILAIVGLGVLELVTMVVLVRAVDDGPPARARTQSWSSIARSAWGRDLLRERNVLWTLAVRLLFLAAVSVTDMGLWYFYRAHGVSFAEAAGLLFVASAIVGGLALLSTLPGARLADRYGRRPVIWAACALCAAGVAGLVLAPTVWVAILAFVPFGIGTGMFLSADWALMTDVIPKEETGRYMGVLNAGVAIGQPLFLLMAGPVLGLFGARAMVLVALFFLLGAAVALLRVDPRRRELGDPPPAEAQAEPLPVPAS